MADGEWLMVNEEIDRTSFFRFLHRPLAINHLPFCTASSDSAVSS